MVWILTCIICYVNQLLIHLTFLSKRRVFVFKLLKRNLFLCLNININLLASLQIDARPFTIHYASALILSPDTPYQYSELDCEYISMQFHSIFSILSWETTKRWSKPPKCHNFTPAELAYMLHISPSYFHAFYKDYFCVQNHPRTLP